MLSGRVVGIAIADAGGIPFAIEASSSSIATISFSSVDVSGYDTIECNYYDTRSATWSNGGLTTVINSD